MLSLLGAVPFIGVLLSFAVLPGAAPRLWHRRMGALMMGWIGLAAGLGIGQHGIAATGALLGQALFVAFGPFMLLLLALYALGGGVLIEGGPWGRPAGNALLLALGAALASVMGTIGASLLLIHPLLAANAGRRERRHLVLAFIVLAGNVGGALSPLGDPPLLAGFLRGVPFFWPLRALLLPTLCIAVPVLLATYLLDRRLARRDPRKEPRRLRIRGALNIALIALLVAAITASGAWHPGTVGIGGIAVPGEQAALALLAALLILVSERFTPRAIRARNRFAWAPMREITLLFLAIFTTIGPVFTLLQQAALDPGRTALWFWASGVASAILDAAPTYLIFFEAAGGNGAHLAAPGQDQLLAALAAGSVFFGPLTYLGNAPNLMVRAIAARRGVRMPGFFAYAAAMTLALLPLYVILTLVFFR